MPVTLRRLLLWTVVCVVSAAPSFVLAAQNKFDRRAMGLGVCVFILIYTALTRTNAFHRFHRRPFVRRTLYIGYGLRMAISMAIPLGAHVDFVPGLLSLGFVETVLLLDPQTFAGTFVTTCVQGTILNVIVFVFMAIVQAFQRIFLKPPPDDLDGPRGFPVILPAAPLPGDPVYNSPVTAFRMFEPTEAERNEK